MICYQMLCNKCVKSRIVWKRECGEINQRCRRRGSNESIGTINRESEKNIWITKTVAERKYWEKEEEATK